MMEAEGDVNGLRALIKSANVYHGHVGLIPQIHQILFRIVEFAAGGNPGAKLDQTIFSAVDAHSNDGLKGKEDKRSESFVAKLIDLQRNGKVTRDNVMDACGANVAAGSDTTGISLSAIVWYLYRSPEKLAKLREELDIAASEGRISNPVTFAEAQQLPYLQAVIKEGLRLHPAVGTILARTVPPTGAELGGIHFPAGVSILRSFTSISMAKM